MYVAHILWIELHERVVYQLHRRRLLISFSIQETSINNSKREQCTIETLINNELVKCNLALKKHFTV